MSDDKKLYVASVKEDAIKVGVSKDVERRIRSLNTGNQDEVVLETSVEIEDAESVEKTMHNQLKEYHRTGEWFDYDALDYALGVLEGIKISDGPSIYEVVNAITDKRREKLIEGREVGWWREVLEEVVEPEFPTKRVCRSCSGIIGRDQRECHLCKYIYEEDEQ